MTEGQDSFFKNAEIYPKSTGIQAFSSLLSYFCNFTHILEYLPPYSPDLNPIEPKCSQAKSRRRKYRCDVDTLFEKYMT